MNHKKEMSDNDEDENRPNNNTAPRREQLKNPKPGVPTEIPRVSVGVNGGTERRMGVDVEDIIRGEIEAEYDKAMLIEDMILYTPTNVLIHRFSGACRLYNAQTLSGDRYYADELESQLRADFEMRNYRIPLPQKTYSDTIRFVIIANTAIGPHMLLRRENPLLRWHFPSMKSPKMFIQEFKTSVERNGTTKLSKTVEDIIIGDSLDVNSGRYFKIKTEKHNFDTSIVPLFIGDERPPVAINVPGEPEYEWVMCTANYKQTTELGSDDSYLLDFILPGLVNMFEGSRFIFS